MRAEDDLAARVRACLASVDGVSEKKMFGGVGFMLNGNMLAGTSKRGLLLRVGKERHADAVAEPGIRMGGLRQEAVRRGLSGILCVRLISSLCDEPFAEDDGELGLGLEPFTRRPLPLLGRVVENEI